MISFGSLIYTLAVVGFIAWIWTRIRATDAPPHAPAKKGKSAKDDLTQIAGIGEVIAGKLNKLGYRRFEQIAAFTKQDIAKVNAQLNFKGRIEREKWVSQAKRLAKKSVKKNFK